MLLILSQKKKNQTMLRYIKLYLDIFSCLCKFIAKHFLWKRGFMLGTNLRQSLQTFFRGGFKRFCALNFICVLNDKTFPIRFILNYCCCFCKNLVFLCVYMPIFSWQLYDKLDVLCKTRYRNIPFKMHNIKM